jgi:hypothetical protein
MIALGCCSFVADVEGLSLRLRVAELRVFLNGKRLKSTTFDQGFLSFADCSGFNTKHTLF